MADVSDVGVPLQAGARLQEGHGMTSFRRSKLVEPELQEAVLEEGRIARPKRKHLQPTEVDQLASQVLRVGQGEENQKDFVERLGALLRDAGEHVHAWPWSDLFAKAYRQDPVAFDRKCTPPSNPYTFEGLPSRA